MRALSNDEIGLVAGGDAYEFCQYAVVGGAGIVVGGALLWGASVMLPLAGAGVTADTLLTLGGGGFVRFSAGQVAAGEATMAAVARAGGVVMSAAGSAVNAAGSLCQYYT